MTTHDTFSLKKQIRDFLDVVHLGTVYYHVPKLQNFGDLMAAMDSYEKIVEKRLERMRLQKQFAARLERIKKKTHELVKLKMVAIDTKPLVRVSEETLASSRVSKNKKRRRKNKTVSVKVLSSDNIGLSTEEIVPIFDGSSSLTEDSLIETIAIAPPVKQKDKAYVQIDIDTNSGPEFTSDDFDALVALQLELDGDNVDPLFVDYAKQMVLQRLPEQYVDTSTGINGSKTPGDDKYGISVCYDGQWRPVTTNVRFNEADYKDFAGNALPRLCTVEKKMEKAG